MRKKIPPPKSELRQTCKKWAPSLVPLVGPSKFFCLHFSPLKDFRPPSEHLKNFAPPQADGPPLPEINDSSLV